MIVKKLSLVSVAMVALTSLLAVGCGTDSDTPDPIQERTIKANILLNSSPLANSKVSLGSQGRTFDTPQTSTTTDTNGDFIIFVPSTVQKVDELFVQVDLNIDSTIASPSILNIREDVSIGQSYQFKFESPNECNQRDKCDLLLPDLTPALDQVKLAPTQLLPEASIRIDTTTIPNKKLLRFATLASNVGAGPLHVIAANEQDETEAINTVQRLWSKDKEFFDTVAGTFIHHPEHDHIHLDEFERYRLLDPSGNIAAEANKVSFCLTDSGKVVGFDNTELNFGVFLGPKCGANQQAINPGYSDYYGAELADQWIDITDVPDGAYQVEITVDPQNILIESNEDNNTVEFKVNINGDQVSAGAALAN